MQMRPKGDAILQCLTESGHRLQDGLDFLAYSF